jgi:hypothetical protein
LFTFNTFADIFLFFQVNMAKCDDIRLLLYPTRTYVTTGVTRVGRTVDSNTIVGTGMDEGKGVADGVYINYDTNMTYTSTRTWTGKEYQVATLQFFAGDGDIACILIS